MNSESEGAARPELTCSFCRRPEGDEIGPLVRAGTSHIAICEACAKLCLAMFAEKLN